MTDFTIVLLKILKPVGLSLVFLTGSCCPLLATSIPITNASFETPALSSGSYVATVSGWTVDAVNNSASTFRPGTQFTSIPDGVNVLALGEPGAGSVSQILPASLTAETEYTLNYSVGDRNDVPFSVYTVYLEANGVVLASDSAGAPGSGQFVSRSIVFDSGSSPAQLGDALTIVVSATGQTSNGTAAQADFDNFSLNSSVQTSVPEPGSFALILLAALAVAARSFRARSKPCAF